MNKRARKALEGSISHWWENYHAAVAGEKIDTSAGACALCLEYYLCSLCPVSKRTGKPFCIGTPFKSVVAATTFLLPPAEFQALVAAEIKFLESLRDYPHQGW